MMHPNALADGPLVFRAVAMPQGDARLSVPGPLVQVIQRGAGRGGRAPRKVMIFILAEAEQLRDQLTAALEAPRLAKQLACDLAGVN